MTKEEVRALLKVEGPELWLKVTKRNDDNKLWCAAIGFKDRIYPEKSINITLCKDWGKSEHRAANNVYLKYLEYRKERPYK